MKAKSNSTPVEQESIDPNRDHWGQPVEQYEPATEAGEQCVCLNCSSRQIALEAGTDPQASGDSWEEFYGCRICDAEGSLRVNGTERRWTGMIGPVEVEG